MDASATLDGTTWIHMVEAACAEVRDRQDWLSALDAACGDGDHGVSMARGFGAVEATLPAWKDLTPGEVLRKLGTTLVTSVGGATGPLLGTFFLEAGKAATGQTAIDTPTLAAMFQAGLAGMCRRGGAKPGDRTMVDALSPAVEAMRVAADTGASPAVALEQAALAARKGADATADMLALQGKSRYLGERVLGHPDPGAHSIAILVSAFAAAAKHRE